MSDRDGWREIVMDIRANSATWWWWWWDIQNDEKTNKQTKKQKQNTTRQKNKIKEKDDHFILIYWIKYLIFSRWIHNNSFYIIIYRSSSSSCRAVSTDIHDNLSPSVPIAHHPREVFYAASCIRTELINVRLCWSTHTGVPMCWLPQEDVAYEFILASPAVSRVSCPSYSDGLGDMWQVAV